MKIRASIITLCLMYVTTSFGAPIIFDFQNVPVGGLPGGFLSLTEDGVTAFFSAAGTTVDVNPVTGVHVLHTGDYHSQMGIEFSASLSQIIIGLDGNIPTTSNFLQTSAYYGPGNDIYSMPTISSSGSTLVFNIPQTIPATGLLVDGNSGGDYISIQLIPEPNAKTLFFLGATTTLVLRLLRWMFGVRCWMLDVPHCICTSIFHLRSAKMFLIIPPVTGHLSSSAPAK